MEKYYFETQREISMNGQFYRVNVEGYKVRGELDYSNTYTGFNKIEVFTETGELLDDDHEDLEEIIQHVMDQDYDQEYEPEGLDNYADCWD